MRRHEPVLGGLIAIVLATASGCTERADQHSEVGELIAQHLCPVQSGCGCREEQLIADCEARVERHFADKESEALAAGLTLHGECLDAFIEEIDEYGTCVPQQFGTTLTPPNEGPPPCPVYGGDRQVGDACTIFEYRPLITDCRAGLTCFHGICEDFENLRPLSEGELCSESGLVPTWTLGSCSEGLHCDLDTQTCVVTPIPLATGDVCTSGDACGLDGYCRTASPDERPSEDNPGTCQPSTTGPGEPCAYLDECENFFCLYGCEGSEQDEEWMCGFNEPNTCFVPPPALCDVLSEWFVEPVDAPAPGG